MQLFVCITDKLDKYITPASDMAVFESKVQLLNFTSLWNSIAATPPIDAELSSKRQSLNSTFAV